MQTTVSEFSTQQSEKHVLICGAGVAGPIVAYWLTHYGVKATIVERSPNLRTMGQTIDIQGSTAKEIVKKMGIDTLIKNNATKEEGTFMVLPNDEPFATFEAGAGPTSEIEIIRGELIKILYDITKDNVEYMFGDFVTCVQDVGDSALVTFNSGLKRNFDIVVAADGQKSKCRRVVFGEDSNLFNSLDLYCCYFTIPYRKADGTRSRIYQAGEGRAIWVRPDGKEETSRAYFMYMSKPTGIEKLKVNEQKSEIEKIFKNVDWIELPRLIKDMHDSKDFYLQEVGQVKSSNWYKDRFVMVGDACYCPSPMSGMGTTAAVVGSYVLACSIATNKSHTEAFKEYEKVMRPYIDKVQKLVPGVPGIVLPRSSFGVWIFRKIITLFSLAVKTGVFSWFAKLLPKSMTEEDDKYLNLPDYDERMKKVN